MIWWMASLTSGASERVTSFMATLRPMSMPKEMRASAATSPTNVPAALHEIFNTLCLCLKAAHTLCMCSHARVEPVTQDNLSCQSYAYHNLPPGICAPTLCPLHAQCLPARLNTDIW